MSRSNKLLSEPSESVNISTFGKWTFIDIYEQQLYFDLRIMICLKAWLSFILMILLTGMEIYPLGSSFLEVLPQPLLAGLLAGFCFLIVAIILSLITACYMNHRRVQQQRKRRQCKILFQFWCCGKCFYYIQNFSDVALIDLSYLLSPLLRSPIPPDKRISSVRAHAYHHYVFFNLFHDSLYLLISCISVIRFKYFSLPCLCQCSLTSSQPRQCPEAEVVSTSSFLPCLFIFTVISIDL